MSLEVELYEAVNHGCETSVRALLRRGANPNLYTGRKPPLMVAANFFPHLIELLVDAGARVEEEYRDRGSGRYMRPLHFAALEETGESIAALVRFGADVRACSDAVFDAARVPVGAGNIRRLAALGADCDVRVGDNRNTPLLIASYFGHLDCVRALIAVGVDVEAVDFRGNTPLRFAVDQGHHEVVGELLDAGAKIEAGMETPEFWTPSQYGRQELAQTLRVITSHLTSRGLLSAMPGDGAAAVPAVGNSGAAVL